MKLRTRLVISFMTIIMIPTLLMSAFTWGIAQYQINLIEKTYGITGTQYKSFSNSINVLQKMPEVRSFLLTMVIWIVLILLFTAMILVFWTYSGIIVPIEKLQQAAKNIKEGNLDFELEIEGDDEMSNLMRDFEEMRVRLKDNAEEKLRKYPVGIKTVKAERILPREAPQGSVS